MPHRLHILKGTEIIPVSEVEWSQWFWVLDNRRIAHTSLESGRFVSTVFLGWQHRMPDPVWFETMIAGIPGLKGDSNQWLAYSATFEEAKATHARMVDRARQVMARRKTPRA